MNKAIEQKIIEELNNMANGFGQFAPTPNENFSARATLMKSTLEELESEVDKDSTSELEFSLAIASRNYTAWYVRGDDRKKFLEKTIFHLHRAVALEPNHLQAKIELARILIEEKQVRDLDSGLKIAEELSRKGLLPSWMDSILQKAKRWKGDIEIPKNSDFSKLDPTPAVLREERTNLRKILSQLTKEDNIDAAQIVALRLYNLAILVAVLYGDHDCNSGVSGFMYDSSGKIMKMIKSKLKYEYMGRIENAKFLSTSDYSKIEKILGEKDTILSIDQIKKMVL